ncbi:phage holin family protein [Paenibacillus thalictri]|uniref:Holin n=1 Tax=Paenibacillus thalictri TaxID=2527873 RepID=A0A4Q9DGK6_9BACL|nr:phage holin family protein [Paenibacillus thalictri]TBL71369.1 holin [Paenibacillus thalictri]
MNQTILNLSAAGIGVGITYAFGRWSELLALFLIAIVIDYVSGVGASIMEHKGLSSDAGFKGVAKKMFMVLLVVLAHRMDMLLEVDWIMTGAICFYLANELISITENYGRMGLPLPDTVKQVITVLKNKGAETGHDHRA